MPEYEFTENEVKFLNAWGERAFMQYSEIVEVTGLSLSECKKIAKKLRDESIIKQRVGFGHEITPYGEDILFHHKRKNNMLSKLEPTPEPVLDDYDTANRLDTLEAHVEPYVTEPVSVEDSLVATGINPQDTRIESEPEEVKVEFSKTKESAFSKLKKWLGMS